MDASPQTLFDKTNPRPTSSIPFSNFDPRQAILLSNYDKLNDTRKNKLLATSETLLAEEQGKIIDITEKRAEYDARKRISLSVPGKVSAGTGWQEDDYDNYGQFLRRWYSRRKRLRHGCYCCWAFNGTQNQTVISFIKLKNQVDLNKIGIFQIDGENYVRN